MDAIGFSNWEGSGREDTEERSERGAQSSLGHGGGSNKNSNFIKTLHSFAILDEKRIIIAEEVNQL